ncbi:MAG: 50S ribosomal protein L25 [Chloroflexaceae bacterium]|nr:50S ribosomal protein L25 [Chloroflexaceae bacterium]
MSTPIQLEAQLRTVLGKGVSRLRREGILPATVYGKDREPLAIQINEKDFLNTYRKIGHSVLVDLKIDGREGFNVFVHMLQRHPVSRAIIHADFRAVDADRPVRVNVALALQGASPVVARGDAIVNQMISSVRVRALPADMPPAMPVDMTLVVRPTQVVQVKDLPTSDKYVIESEPELILISLTGVKRRA